MSPNEIVLAALEKRRHTLEEKQHELLHQAESQLQTSQGEPHEWTPSDQADSGPDHSNQPSLIVNAQIAQLKAEIEKYNAQPRQHYTGPSARRHSYARYLETWRQHIEQLGTEYYPEQARGRIYGSLQLTVYINTDGSLAKVEIDRPSDHPILNAAALRIVQLAAPFAPLSKEIAKETDVLAITRTWHFQNAQLTTHHP